MKKTLILLILTIMTILPTFSWDGYDVDNGHSIEIEKGNLVRRGKDIEVYDYDTGEYKEYEVESVNGREVEVYDYDTGEYRTFDMD